MNIVSRVSRLKTLQNYIKLLHNTTFATSFNKSKYMAMHKRRSDNIHEHVDIFCGVITYVKMIAS